MPLPIKLASMPSRRESKSSYSVAENLRDVYFNKIKPIEDQSLFSNFHSPSVTSGEMAAKPMVLLLGQYSTGKTTFIQHLLGRNYPGAHIGPEPTTDRFVAVVHGEDERVVPGNAAATQADKPFTGLNQFGSDFLSKFQIAESPAALLDSVTFIDTPGVLSGDKQRLGRSYDFVKVCRWFAERADMILILFDAHKLDISDELKDVITAIRPYEEKIKIVLNKADQINNQELMRVYGALMWSLGKTINTPEVVRVYIGSFWSPASQPEQVAHGNLLEAEQNDLINNLLNLPKDSAIRKINEMIKRAKLVRVHSLILSELRSQMPTLWGKSTKQNKLVTNMKEELYKIQQKYQIPYSDIPDPGLYQDVLKGMNLSQLPKASSRLFEQLNEAIKVELPAMLSKFMATYIKIESVAHNPFDNAVLKPKLEPESCQDRYIRIFHQLNPENGYLSGEKVRNLFGSSGLEKTQLAEIWTQADEDQDGHLTQFEFCTAMRLIDELK